ncbi:MAG: Na+/H+ antiporter NhaA [Candidatus Dormibacteraeota bacterium]|nr:Na+/H+ antiporter NhaA [Candidatus Dormibacteraeota bacterium]
MAAAAEAPFSGRTAWARSVHAPLRRFLRTETGSATVLVVAALVALAWANIGPRSYLDVWHTQLALGLGRWVLSLDLVTWINSGLMAFFFFVVGLEVRREVDLGELRERRRVALPLLAGAGGMIAAVAIYLAANTGRPSAGGWGVAMSTDTAFALGVLALLGRNLPDRLRGFMLTVVVVDDVVALAVIALVYSKAFVPAALIVACALFVLVLAAAALRVRQGLVYAVLALAAWVALLESGIDPLVIGLAMGLVAYAAPPERADLERATSLFRVFREQPTPELARSARAGLESALSPNERLQRLYHPWTSYVVVPLFALANAGISIDGRFLAEAYTSPITLGIVLGYVVGKPAGIFGTSWLVTTLSRGRLRPPVGWAAVAGSGTVAGIGFTVSLLIATLAFRGAQLQEAKLGVLTAALAAAVFSLLAFRASSLLPARLRVRALLGTSEVLVDLADPVDPERDHVRGPEDAPVTLVEYGDFECPYCGQAEPVLRELLRDMGDVRYVWRHLPLSDVHPHAQLAAEASEAAAAQGVFWEMHDTLLAHQDALRVSDLIGHAEQLGLDVERFERDLRRHAGAGRVGADVDSADLSGVSGTPTFFVNGRRHYGAYDIQSLSRAVRDARARAALAS